jgi:flagellar biosynthesis anti-sigma factor FlgM
VNITSTAALLARLAHSLASRPPVDQNRVDTISKALAAGTYQVNPDKIAQGLRNFQRILDPLPLKEI